MLFSRLLLSSRLTTLTQSTFRKGEVVAHKAATATVPKLWRLDTNSMLDASNSASRGGA